MGVGRLPAIEEEHNQIGKTICLMEKRQFQTKNFEKKSREKRGSVKSERETNDKDSAEEVEI